MDRGQKVQWMDEVITNGSSSEGSMDRGQYQAKDIVFELGYLGRDEDVQCLGSWVLRNSMLQWIFEGQEVQ